MHRDFINQVRELLERFDVAEISHKLNVDVELVKMAVDIIQDLLT